MERKLSDSQKGNFRMKLKGYLKEIVEPSLTNSHLKLIIKLSVEEFSVYETVRIFQII